MTEEGTWFEANRAMWDERVPIHVGSRFYDVEGFLAGRDCLRPFERDEVGDVSGKALLHLQCHFGLDTLSWARHGARVSGLDFSAPAVDTAARLAGELGITADFVTANVYDAVAALNGRHFDVVYTGLGALIWLPDIAHWARIVAELLAPGGFLYLSEFHPLADIMADASLTVTTDYFKTDPRFYDEPGTYVDFEAPTVNNASYEWVHPISEVVTALLDAGLSLEMLHEHDYTLFQRWPFLEHHGIDDFRMPVGMPRVPLMYSLRASKPG